MSPAVVFRHRVVRAAARSVAVASVILAIACVDAMGPGTWRVRAATLEHYGSPSSITVPETAQRHTAFNVEFITYGGGCVEPAENLVTSIGLDVRIVSSQREYMPRENEACTQELRLEQNVVPLTLSGVGTARIRVFGRRMPGDETLVLERSVDVTP